MPAPALSQGPSPSRADAVEAFRQALAAYAVDDRAFDRVSSAIHTLAAVARAEQLTPEQMLIEFKVMLGDAPALRVAPSEAAGSLRARLVTAAIRAYYAETGAS